MAAEQGRVQAPLTGAYALLDPETGALIKRVLGRRDPELDVRLAGGDEVSEQDVEHTQRVLYDEFAEQLSREDHEPTEYGKQVDNALGAFVTAFLIERR